MQQGIKLNGSDMERLRKIYERLGKEEKEIVKPLWASAKEEFSPLAVIRLLMSREESR